jgi:hypothetical protein
VNRNQFLRALRNYCKAQGLPKPAFDATHGKGGHGEVSIGDRFTTIPSGELKKGTKEGILKQLGLPKDAV